LVGGDEKTMNTGRYARKFRSPAEKDFFNTIRLKHDIGSAAAEFSNQCARA
jgi:hypothetical protein